MMITLNGKRVKLRMGDSRHEPNMLRGYISACCHLPVEIMDDCRPTPGFKSFTLMCGDCGEVLELKDVLEEAELSVTVTAPPPTYKVELA